MNTTSVYVALDQHECLALLAHAADTVKEHASDTTTGTIVLPGQMLCGKGEPLCKL